MYGYLILLILYFIIGDYVDYVDYVDQLIGFRRAEGTGPSHC